MRIAEDFTAVAASTDHLADQVNGGCMAMPETALVDGARLPIRVASAGTSNPAQLRSVRT